MRVVLAPDSFKGSATAAEAAAALAAGWRSIRPLDELVQLPQADGGEGSLEALAAASGGIRHRVPVLLPGGEHLAQWLELPDGTGFVELAECCGLPLWGTGDPLGASSAAFGTVIAAALDAGVEALVLAIGGSASTDGGAGALQQLGLRLLDAAGRPLGDRGGAGLAAVASIDRSGLRRPPAGGLRVLCDVTNPLLGPAGAAAVFAPQKGADPEQVSTLEAGLAAFHRAVGGDADLPGAGAAGGLGYGLSQVWDGQLVSGSATLSALTGLDSLIAGGVDLLVTGEGSFDSQSLGGKITGHLVDLAAGRCPVAVVAGRIEGRHPFVVESLTELAGDTAAAMAEPGRWLEAAGRALAAKI